MYTISSEEVEKNCLHVETSIRGVRWLAFQGTFKGHDKSPSSLNRGNFLEMI